MYALIFSLLVRGAALGMAAAAAWAATRAGDGGRGGGGGGLQADLCSDQCARWQEPPQYAAARQRVQVDNGASGEEGQGGLAHGMRRIIWLLFKLELHLQVEVTGTPVVGKANNWPWPVFF